MNETPTPRTEEILGDLHNWFRATQGADAGAKWAVVKDKINGLERELAEAKAEALTWAESSNTASEQRDAARADAQRWRECAETLRQAVSRLCGRECKDRECGDAVCVSIRLYNELCQSPTPSSPPSPSPEPSYLEVCVMCGAKITSWIGNKAICGNCKMTAEPAQSIVPPWTGAKPTAEELQAILDGPSSPPTAPAPAAPETETASRLQALQSALDTLRLRTEYLMVLFCELKGFLDNVPDIHWSWSSKTVWPAALVPTASTSTSQPTPKPERSGDAASA